MGLAKSLYPTASTYVSEKQGTVCRVLQSVADSGSQASLMWRTRKIRWGDWVIRRRRGDVTQVVYLSPGFGVWYAVATPLLVILMYAIRSANKDLHLL